MFGCSSKDLDAKVVNNALVVSFLTADPPRVWRADMTGLSTATLELREGQPGRFRLVMKTGAGKEEDVSTFNDRETAANALRVVTNAMLQGGGGSVSGGMTAPSSGGGFFRGLFKAIAWGVGILAVLWLLLHLITFSMHGGPAPHLPEGVKPGAAVPADRIFGGQ